jgi:hypothetical protein
MTYRTTGAIAAIVLVAACSGQGGGNEAAADGAAPAGSGTTDVAFLPGQWETTVTVARMTVPGMPDGMTPPPIPPTTVSHCMTPEEARRPNADFLSGNTEGSGCELQDFSMTGGRLRGTITCASEGATMRSVMDGQFTPTSYEMTSQVETAANGMTMQMEARTSARRVGDCTAG